MNTPEELWDKYMEDTYILECLNVDLVVKRAIRGVFHV